MDRPNWHQYFLNIAKEVALRGTCLRRNYGAVIVDQDNVIISTGYTGAPRGKINCTKRGTCKRQELNIPSGQRYELCESVHAEMNAVINGDPVKMKGATMYVNGISGKLSSIDEVNIRPCPLCSRVIINARINRVVVPFNNDRGYEVYHAEGLIF